MSLTQKTKDKKVNIELNKEYISVVTSSIANKYAEVITNTFSNIKSTYAAYIIVPLCLNYR